jgi:hypothetical protein
MVSVLKMINNRTCCACVCVKYARIFIYIPISVHLVTLSTLGILILGVGLRNVYECKWDWCARCTDKVVYMCFVRFHRRNTILAFTLNSHRVITRNSGQCTKKKKTRAFDLKKKKNDQKRFYQTINGISLTIEHNIYA